MIGFILVIYCWTVKLTTTVMQLGPQKPLPTGETPTMLRQRLIGMLSIQFPDEAPFTIQRLCELLLEPHKHYTRIEKLVTLPFSLIYISACRQCISTNLYSQFRHVYRHWHWKSW